MVLLLLLFIIFEKEKDKVKWCRRCRLPPKVPKSTHRGVKNKSLGWSLHRLHLLYFIKGDPRATSATSATNATSATYATSATHATPSSRTPLPRTLSTSSRTPLPRTLSTSSHYQPPQPPQPTIYIYTYIYIYIHIYVYTHTHTQTLSIRPLPRVHPSLQHQELN
jgi:hypothetical protein